MNAVFFSFPFKAVSLSFAKDITPHIETIIEKVKIVAINFAKYFFISSILSFIKKGI
jgi:hypothetical protein